MPNDVGPILPSRKRTDSVKARIINLEQLQVVRLPIPKEPSASSEKAPSRKHFEIHGGDWSLIGEEPIPASSRVNSAYKEILHTTRFTHWVDPKGKSVGSDNGSVLRVTDQNGDVIANQALVHDVYRSAVNPDGTAVLFLSREGVIHGYTEKLAPLVLQSLAKMPEYQRQADRFRIRSDEIKNHARVISISPDKRRYLITVVDEAWCVDTASGEVVWACRMPSKEDWTRVVASRTERAGPSTEIDLALNLMQLSLPVTPSEITKQYRELAMRWHPDHNPGDPKATGRFQQLAAAMELLIGADLSNLSLSDNADLTYEKVLSRESFSVKSEAEADINVVLTTSIRVDESYASDWIYAGYITDNSAVLAAYSGKVVTVSRQGMPERVYDIGSIPSSIASDGTYLYLLTDARLFILSGDIIVALVDIIGAGEIMLGDNGIMLLGPRIVACYTKNGRLLSMVKTKDPLRSVRATTDGVIVETRQHRAFVEGAWTHPA